MMGILIALTISAEQMPKDYYKAADGKKDAELKTALSKIIYPVDWSAMTQTSSKPNFIKTEYNAGNRCKYGARGVDEKHSHQYTWDGFLYTDTKEDNSIWDMYSNRVHFMALDIYGAVSIPDLEIEHCFPKSWWGGSASTNENDAFMDLHHLNPANARANNNKGHNPPGYVKTKEDKKSNDIFIMGKNDDYGDFYVFEPCDEYKGDFARAYFYVVTAYENFVWQDVAKEYLDNDSWQEFKPWMQKVLVEWHKLDPVSEKEIVRNNAVSDIQHNRNPFIDYPELVDYLWGDKTGTAVKFADLTFTGSDDYELPVEQMGCTARFATDITKDGFVANWRHRDVENYQLDVFRKKITGKNDTLLNYPIFAASLVKTEEHFTTSGSINTTGAGKSSVTFGTVSTPLVLTISGITIPENAHITVRAIAPMKINNTEGAQMKISADGTQIALQTLTFDETSYTFDIPKGTKNIVIEQGNGKLFNVQQMFIYAGDLSVTEEKLEGYPVTVTGISHKVECNLAKGDKVYYRVTPKGKDVSNTIEVMYTGDPQGTEQLQSVPQENVQKVFENGVLIIIRDGVRYSIVGQRL